MRPIQKIIFTLTIGTIFICSNSAQKIVFRSISTLITPYYKHNFGIAAGHNFFYGDVKSAKKIVPGITLNYQLNLRRKFSVGANFQTGNYKGYRNSDTSFKDNFSFSSFSNEFNLQLGYHIKINAKLSANVFAGFGIANFNSKAQFTDMRRFITLNPNYGKNVEETYDGRHWIVPVTLQVNYQLKPQLALTCSYRQTYLRNDDIDVYNTEIWDNKWFDQLGNLRIGIQYSLEKINSRKVSSKKLP